MRLGSALLLGGVGLAAWHFGRRSPMLRPYLPLSWLPSAPAGAAVPVAALAARAASALESSRVAMTSSRGHLSRRDVELALQQHTAAWWMVGAAAVLATYARNAALDEEIRAQAARLDVDSRRFEELAVRGQGALGVR